MTEALEKQIKTFKKAFIPHLICTLLFAFPIIAICFASSEGKCLQKFVCIAFFGIFFGIYFAVFLKSFSIYRTLKKARGRKTEAAETECIDIRIMFNPSGKRNIYIIGVRIIGSDNKKYFYPLPKKLPEYNETWSKPFKAGTEFFAKKLKGKRLHMKCYEGTNLIHEIKEFPNYEIEKIPPYSLITKK